MDRILHRFFLGLGSVLGGSWAPRRPQDAPKTGPRRPKTAPKTAPRRSRRPQDAPGQPQDAPKRAQNAHLTPQAPPRSPKSRPAPLQTSILEHFLNILAPIWIRFYDRFGIFLIDFRFRLAVYDPFSRIVLGPSDSDRRQVLDGTTSEVCSGGVPRSVLNQFFHWKTKFFEKTHFRS